MADLEQRVDKLEEKVSKMEIELNSSLKDIQADVKEIKSCITGNNDNSDLKNQLIEKDVKSNTARIKRLENNQSKVVWALLGELFAVVSAAVVAAIKYFN